MQGIEKLRVVDKDGGTVLSVKVVPGSSRDRIAGVLGESLKVTVSAAPEKGRANEAVAKVLAVALGVPWREVELVSGASNPRKEFFVAGLTGQEVKARLVKLE